MTAAQVRLYGLLGLMTLFWSINYITAKIALRSFSPLLFSSLRTCIAAACLIPIYFVAQKRFPQHHTPWTLQEMPLLISLGLFGIALNQVLFILGMARTTVAHASLIVATTPVTVLLLAWLKGQEHFSARKILGLATAFGGIAVLNLMPGRAERGATLTGDLLVFAATVTFSVYTVAGKEIAFQHGSITINTLGFLAAAAALAPVAWFVGRDFQWGQTPVGAWICLVYMAVCGSVLAYLIFNYALGKISASRAASFSYSQPLIATLIGVAVLGEPVTWGIALSGLLVLSGVWLVGRG